MFEVARVCHARALKTALKALSFRAREKDFRESAFLPPLALTRRPRGAQTRITSSELLDERRRRRPTSTV
jgi:hypothetical protein